VSVETLLNRLDKVRQTGPGKWIARCPAHQDKSPSLSVLDTGTRTVIHCFAGCEAEDVLAAVGLAWRDLYRGEWKAAREAAAHQRAKLPRPDPLEIERKVIAIAVARLEAGEELNTYDLARYEIALERVKGAA